MDLESVKNGRAKAEELKSDPDEFRRRFETAAELATDGLLMLDAEDRIVFASATAVELLGLNQDELYGKGPSDIFTSGSREAFSSLRAKADHEPGRRHSKEMRVTPAWGRSMEVLVHIIRQPTDGYLFISLEDISLSKMMEKELVKSNQFLRKIIMNSVDGIIAADISGTILLFNHGAARMLGWAEEDVIGRMHVRDLMEAGQAEEIMQRLRRDDPHDGPACMLHPIQVTMKSRSGEKFPAHLSAATIFDGGEEVATVGIFTDLRDRVAMEKALEETRDYLNNVLENAFDLIITTDTDSVIVSFNRGGERMLGYNREEVIGRKLNNLFADPAEITALLRRLEHFDGSVSNYETRMRCKNGELLDMSLTMSLLTDNQGRVIGTVGISKDVTARKKAEAALQETKDYLDAIVENATDMIITTNLNKRIVSFNRGAERILGYRRDEILGVHIEDLYVEREERQALARYLSDQEAAVNYETQLRARDGSVVDIDLTLSHLKSPSGQIIGTVGISKDITEKKRFEIELRATQAQLKEAQLQLMHSEKMASLGKLATSVAHEINNPLGGILLFCEMILEEIPDGDVIRPDLLQIRDQTLRCKEIVKGLLEFGRMTGTHYTFIDINRTVEQGIALFANQAIFQNIKVNSRLHPRLPQIMGDASQLNQVFTNLIINAIDSMEGEGELTIETELDEAAEEVTVRFADTGRGIDPEVMPRLFEPFFTTKPVGEGVGLGLSTSYSIVKRHHGRIEIDSEPGRGASFTVHLPLAGLEEE